MIAQSTPFACHQTPRATGKSPDRMTVDGESSCQAWMIPKGKSKWRMGQFGISMDFQHFLKQLMHIDDPHRKLTWHPISDTFSLRHHDPHLETSPNSQFKSWASAYDTPWLSVAFLNKPSWQLVPKKFSISGIDEKKPELCEICICWWKTKTIFYLIA